MNVKFENDRKHCALQISWKYFGTWLSRHVASLICGLKISGQFWKFGNLICSNHLWVPCLIHINTFVETHRHTHTTLQQVSPKIKTKWVCYNLQAVRAFIVHFLSAFLSVISLLAKLPWLRKLSTVFVIIRQAARARACVCVCVCECVQNLTNFCPYALISTPNVPSIFFTWQLSHPLPLDRFLRSIVLRFFFTKNRQFAAIDCDVFMCGSYRIAGSELPRGLGPYVSPYLYSAINVRVLY